MCSSAGGPVVARYGLRTIALAYLLFLVVLPVGLICWTTFADGVGPVIDALTTPSALHAFKVTAQVAVFSVIANTLFGVGVALLLVRHEFRGKRVLNLLVDLPIAVSPVVVGLALILVYGRFAPVGGWLAARHGPGDGVRLPAAGRPGGHAGARGDRDRAGTGRLDAGRITRADLPAR